MLFNGSVGALKDLRECEARQSKSIKMKPRALSTRHILRPLSRVKTLGRWVEEPILEDKSSRCREELRDQNFGP